MSAPDWADALAEQVRRSADVADRLDALEALVTDLTLAVLRLNAAVRGGYLADEAADLRRAAVAAEARRAAR